MQARKLTLVEIGVGGLPSASPVAPRFSTWFPVPFKAPDVPPANGVTPTPVADGVVLEWDAVNLEGVVYVISRSENQNGPWTEIHRTTETRYVYSDGSGKTWWFQITPTVRGKTGTGTVVGVVPPTTSKDLAEQQAKLAAEISARIQAIADEAAARAAGLAQAAQDLVAEALLRQQGVTEALQAVSAEAQARIDALLNEKLEREAAISHERQLRQSADESLARAVSEVAAGSGTQFDSIKLWPFNQTTEGWTGNGAPTLVDGWLRPANHATAPWVQSPVALAVDGSAYRFVKLRVKRVGSPTWSGFLQWITATDQAWNTQKRVAIPEPAWDVNGVATVDVQDIAWWPATVDAIRLQLGAAQNVASYYLIDYIAVGRPQPGASVALVQEETQARITADAAEATQRTALAVQMRGNYTGTDPLQLTAGLAYEELKARVAADSAQVQRISTMEARMPVGTGSLATAASVTALQEATATTTNALAQSITTINATLPSMISQGSNLVVNGGWQAGRDVGWSYSSPTMLVAATEGRAGSAAFRADGVNGVRTAIANGILPGGRDMEAKPGKKYRYGCWYRTTADFNGTPDNSKLRLGTQTAALVGGATPFLPGKSEWTYLGAVYTVAENTSITALQLSLTMNHTAGTLWVDDVALEEVTELLANAQAISDLSTSVTQLGNTVTSQAGQLTALRSDLTGVSGRTDANASALQNLTTRVTTAEGKIDSTSTSVTKLQSEMKASLAGGGGMFPSGTFEQFADGHLLSQGYGTTFTVNTSAKRNGNRGLLIQVPSDARPDLNADCYPVTEFIPLVGVRRLYVEAWAALSSGSAEIPPDNKSNLRIGVQTSAAGVGGTSNVWTTVNWGVASLSKTSWTKVSGYVTTNASAAQGRLFVSLPGHATDPKSQRVIGSILLLDDIVITDVTEAYGAQQSSEANAQAITGLASRVTSAENTLASTASQVTDLNTTITTTFNRGDNINTNSGFDGGMAPFVKTNTGATGGDIVWSNGAGQIGSAVDVTVVQNATQSPGLFANGNRWSGMKAGTGRRMRTVVVARAISGTASITARCRVRTGGVAGEGNNDQTTPNLTTEWQRFQLEHPIGDDRTEVLSHVWVTNRAGSTGPARVLIDRIEFYDITNEVKITANAAATAGLTTAVNQQGSKLDATAQDLVSLKTQVGDVSAAGFNQLQTKVTQQGDAQVAQAQQITGLQSTVAGKANASVVVELDTKVNGTMGGGGNLLVNSSFEENASGWFHAWNPGGWGNITRDLAGLDWRPANGHNIGVYKGGVVAPNNYAVIYVTPYVTVQQGKRYMFSAKIAGHRSQRRLAIKFMDGAGNMLSEPATSWHSSSQYGDTGGVQLANWEFDYLAAVAPAGAVYAAVGLWADGNNQNDPYVWMTQPMFEEVPASKSYPSPWSAGGRDASASWSVMTDVNGYIAGLQLKNSGNTSNFRVLADKFEIAAPNGGQRTEYSDGNWRTYYPNGQLATRMGWWQ
ncbi:hypothetical protein JJL50_09070 [Stenotrophomonas maltophilia]|uniref:DUF1983 domain-containing protein n=1 Tax=Stenotrophomonas maltophilia TaxID=40324 RepID=A0ABD7C851_STEMA|nr:hypothetical protein [Stenotrophomonas maltophilia]QQQ44151.1 hypothetical protein JJL50_09070 [Stenotrophomonas maltophilia]